jgi:hypothetical protein
MTKNTLALILMLALLVMQNIAQASDTLTTDMTLNDCISNVMADETTYEIDESEAESFCESYLD